MFGLVVLVLLALVVAGDWEATMGVRTQFFRERPTFVNDKRSRKTEPPPPHSFLLLFVSIFRDRPTFDGGERPRSTEYPPIFT